MKDDDEFRFNDASTHEGHLRQNGELTWFCNETVIMISHNLHESSLLLNNESNLVDHFVSSPRGREKMMYVNSANPVQTAPR